MIIIVMHSRQFLWITGEGTTLLTLLPVFLSQLGCWLFFYLKFALVRASVSFQRDSTTRLHLFNFFEQTNEVFQLSIIPSQVQTIKNIEEN